MTGERIPLNGKVDFTMMYVAHTYLPWVLDGASPSMQADVLALLPPPARILYRSVWAPKYQRAAHWRGVA